MGAVFSNRHAWLPIPEGFVCRECGEYLEDAEPAYIVDARPLCSERCYHAYTTDEERGGFAARFGSADEENDL
jgi:hypothetical protein